MDAAQWDERYRSADLVWGVEPNQFIRQQCERLPVGEAVDLACGEGRNALWLARLGWRVVGVDFSATAVARARELTRLESDAVQGRITWHVADVTQWTRRVESADLVLISYVHLPPIERYQLIRSAARAVRPGGHVVLVGHDRRNLLEGVGGPQDATLLYVPAEIAVRLRREGLAVDLAETLPRTTDNGTALDTLVLARRPTQEIGSRHGHP